MKGKNNEKEPLLVAHRDISGEEWFVINFDDERVVARTVEAEVADFVDEIDALHRALGLKFAIDDGRGVGGIEAEGDADSMLALRYVAERHEPDHERMHDRELARADVGKNTEDGVFTGRRIDVYAVARDPDQNLGFALHERAMLPGWPGSGQAGNSLPSWNDLSL